MRSRRVAELLLLSGIALATPVLSQAAPAQPETAHRPSQPPGPPDGERGMPGPVSPGMQGPRAPGLPFFLGRVHLSEEQDDRVFALVHAQEPAMRKANKAVEHTRRDLHEMVMSGNYDEAKASALARSGADAAAEASLIRARIDSQVLRILTPEQRKQITERAPGFPPPHGPDSPPQR